MDNSTDEVTAVQRVIDDYQVTVNEGNASAYGQLFAVDAIRMPPNAPDNVGRDALTSEQAEAYEKWQFQVSMNYLQTEVYGDRAHLIADVHGHLDAHEGDDQMDIRFTALWLFKRDDGSNTWKIVAQMWKNTPASGSAF